MRKKWLALCAVFAFLFAAFFSLWLEKPVLMQKLSETVTTTVDDKINGTLSFQTMDVSFTGQVTLTEPIIKDTKGRVVLSGSQIAVQINTWKLLSSLSNGRTAAAIDTVDVSQPVVHIWQNQPDKTWNVATLMKPSQDKSDAGFRAAVRFQDGTVRLQLADGTLLVGEDAEGTVDFASYPKMYADASLSVDGEKLTASGHYTSSRDFDMIVHGDSVRASYVNPFVPAGTDVTVDGGQIRNIRVRYSQNQRGQSFSGSAEAEKLAGTVSGFSYEDVSGKVRLDDQSVYLDEASGRINGQKVRADGEIRIDGDTPVFQLDLALPGAELAAFADVLPVAVTGSVGFTGRIWGTVQELRASGTVTVPELEYEGLVLTDGKATIVTNGDTIDIEDLSANIAGGSFRGQGSYDMASGNFGADVHAADIQLEAIPQLPAAVLGSVTADVTIAGNRSDGSLQASGYATAAGLSYNGLEADQAAADFTYADGVLALDSLTASVQGGTLAAQGVFDTQGDRTNISFTADDLPLSLAENYVSLSLAGTFSAAGHLYGAAPDWDIIFRARTGSIQGMPFDSLDGTLSGSASLIRIPSLVWRYVDGLHEANGTINLDSRRLELEVATKHMRLERILPVLGREDLPLTGWADNTVRVTGTLDQPRAEGSFQLTSGSAYGYLYKNVSANYRLAGGTLYIDHGDISAYDASISVQGSLGERLNLDLDGKNLDIARIVPHKGPQRAGIVQLKGHVGGTVDNPAFDGSIRADRLVFNQTALEHIQGDVGYHGGILRLTDFHFDQNGGSYDARGGYNPDNGWIMVRASVAAGDLGSLLKLAGVTNTDVSGRIDGKLSVDGTTEAPKARLTGQLSQAFIGTTAVEPTDIDVLYENDVIQIKKLSLNAGGGLLAAEGTYALHGPVQMQLAAKNFPTRLITALAGRKDIDLDTRIDFAANLSGTGDHPNADVSLETGGGTINGISFSSVYALLNIRDRIINVKKAYAAKDPYKVSASGTIPIAALTGEKTGESMDVTVHLDNAGLDLLTFLTPMITDAQGGLDGSIQLRGTAAAPELYGSLGIQNGSFSIKTVKYPLSNIKGQLHLLGKTASFTASAVMDKPKAKQPGNVQLQGQAAWQGWQFTNYAVQATLDRLAVECPYFTGPLNGQ